MKYVVLLSLLLVGCGKTYTQKDIERFNGISQQANSYKLSNGEYVNCRRAFAASCGVMLSMCNDHREYSCQINVVQESQYE